MSSRAFLSGSGFGSCSRIGRFGSKPSSVKMLNMSLLNTDFRVRSCNITEDILLKSYGKTFDDWVLLTFSSEMAEAERLYREFVRAGLKADAPWKEITGQIYLGSEKFISKIKKFISGKETIREIPKTQRYITRPSLEDIFKQKDKSNKDKAVYEAHVRYGYTLKDTADYLGVHYATVSRIVKRVEEKKLYCKT